MRYSSKCAQQPLIKNAGAITPAQSESVNATKPSCHILRLLLNLSILQVNWLGKGMAADAADTKSFSCIRSTKALLCLTACLFLTHQHVTCSLTSFTISLQFPNQLIFWHFCSALSSPQMGSKRYYLIPSEFPLEFIYPIHCAI